MLDFKLTHFDRVWQTLGDPANGAGLAEAYRDHFPRAHAPGTPEDMAGCLNFLLSRCVGGPELRPEDVSRSGANWIIRLRNGESARKLEAYAREQVGLFPGARLQTRHLPRVKRALFATAGLWLGRTFAAFSGRSASSQAALPAALIQQERPYAERIEEPAPADQDASGADTAQVVRVRGHRDLGHYTAHTGTVQAAAPLQPPSHARGVSP